MLGYYCAGIDISRQNPTSDTVDPRTERIKQIVMPVDP